MIPKLPGSPLDDGPRNLGWSDESLMDLLSVRLVFSQVGGVCLWRVLCLHHDSVIVKLSQQSVYHSQCLLTTVHTHTHHRHPSPDITRYGLETGLSSYLTHDALVSSLYRGMCDQPVRLQTRQDIPLSDQSVSSGVSSSRLCEGDGWQEYQDAYRQS